MSYQLSDSIQKGTLFLLKHDMDFFTQIVPLIKAEYFDFPSYQRIFSCVRDYYQKYKTLPNDEALVDYIKFTTPSGVKDDNDYEDDLLGINNIDKSVVNHKEFVMDLVEDFARKSAMKDAIRKSIVLLEKDNVSDIENLVKEALLVNRNIEVGQDYFADVRDRVGRMFSLKNEDKFKTVFSSMDSNLEGGLNSKELAIVVAPPGCHAKGTKILMHDGTSKNVEDVVVGDLLMGPDSAPRTVLSLATGVEEMRRIIPTKGDPFVVNKSHILSLNRKASKSKRLKERVTNITVLDYQNKSNTFKAKHKLYRVGVNFQEKNLEVDPYILGILLGDGTINKTVGVTTMDSEIKESFQGFALGYNDVYIREAVKPNNKAATFFASYKKGIENPIVTSLKSIGVYGTSCGNKRIPIEYKTSSRKQRLELLAGLIDTDGSLSSNCFDICLKSEELVDDTIFVARSLGFAAYKATRVINGVDYFRTIISGEINQIPTRLLKKKANRRQQIKDVLKTSFSVENLPIDNYYGFELDKDHLYLTSDFTVHHNTGKSLYLVNQGAKSLKEGRNVLYISCEMSEDKIGARFDSVLTLLKNSKLKEPATQLTLHKRLDMVKEATKGRLIIKEFPTGVANVNQIRSLLTQLRLYKDFKPDLIIVDYLELLRPNRIIDAEYMAQQRIAEELRGLGVENKCLIWTASQTNRQARRVHTITDAELGDSYGKIRPADWVISLNQTEEEYNKGQMRVYVIKARDSKQHYTVPITVNYSNLRMEESTNDEEATELKV